MLVHKTRPVESFDSLRSRVERLFHGQRRYAKSGRQLSFDLPVHVNPERYITSPKTSIVAFLDFLSGAVPVGNVYLFGGVLRDLAILGREGFSSDIDLVVEGGWSDCAPYIETLGARRNKFGGYRLQIAGWPVDVWNAEETWAIKQGLVEYRGVQSLTNTTVLNWDAILMNWRTRDFIARSHYIENIQAGVLDVVLKENPDPLGMLVRVLRHLWLKDARKITQTTATYLARSLQSYGFEEVRQRELASYGASVIELTAYTFFKHCVEAREVNRHSGSSIPDELVRSDLGLE